MLDHAFSFGEITDHDHTGRDPDAPRQFLFRRQRGNRLHQLKRREDGTLGVVFPRLRIAEIHERAVAEMLRHKAIVGRDRLGNAAPIPARQRAQIFRVEPRRQAGRADEVTEQHRELAPLDTRTCRRRRCTGSVLKLRPAVHFRGHDAAMNSNLIE